VYASTNPTSVMKGCIMQDATTKVGFSTKVGAWLLMTVLVIVTGVLPGLFMLVFMNGMFMFIYLSIENFLHVGKRLDEQVQEFNEENMKDGKPAEAAIHFLGEKGKPIIKDWKENFNFNSSK
jgi:hypothetical protein